MVQKEKRRGKEVLNGFKPVHIWMLSLAIINAYLGYNDKYPMILKKYKAIWKKLQADGINIPDTFIHGVPKSNDFFNNTLEFMINCFQIYNKEDFLAKVTIEIENSPIFQTYTKRRSILMALPIHERVGFITNNDEVFGFINHYEPSLTPAGILGYEISTRVQMCRLAYYMGYIGRDELFRYIQPYAVLAQKNFNSFREYGLSCITGLLFFLEFFNSRNLRYISESTLIKLLHWLLNARESPWTNLPWNIAIQDL